MGGSIVFIHLPLVTGSRYRSWVNVHSTSDGGYGFSGIPTSFLGGFSTEGSCDPGYRQEGFILCRSPGSRW